MTVTDVIDLIMRDVDNVPANDADLTDLRTEILDDIYEVASYVQGRRSMDSRMTTAKITTVNGAAVVPTGFEQIGPKGGVWLYSNGAPLRYVEPRVIIQQRQQGLTTDTPCEYSMFEDNVSDFLHSVQVASGSGVELWLGYVQGVPTLDDSTNADNLKVIPERWHRGVIVPGVRAARRLDKGDGGAAKHFSEDPGFARALKQMVIAERSGRERSRQLPSFFGE